MASTVVIRLGVVALVAAGLWLTFGDLPAYYYAVGAVLIVPAVGFVLIRKHNWFQALFTGTLATLVVAFLVAAPFIAYKSAMGDFASDPDCDGFCLDNTGGTIFASIIVTLIAAMYAGVGGFVSGVVTFIVRGNPSVDEQMTPPGSDGSREPRREPA